MNDDQFKASSLRGVAERLIGSAQKLLDSHDEVSAFVAVSSGTIALALAEDLERFHG